MARRRRIRRAAMPPPGISSNVAWRRVLLSLYRLFEMEATTALIALTPFFSSLLT